MRGTEQRPEIGLNVYKKLICDQGDISVSPINGEKVIYSINCGEHIYWIKVKRKQHLCLISENKFEIDQTFKCKKKKKWNLRNPRRKHGLVFLKYWRKHDVKAKKS